MSDTLTLELASRPDKFVAGLKVASDAAEAFRKKILGIQKSIDGMVGSLGGKAGSGIGKAVAGQAKAADQVATKLSNVDQVLRRIRAAGEQAAEGFRKVKLAGDDLLRPIRAVGLEVDSAKRKFEVFANNSKSRLVEAGVAAVRWKSSVASVGPALSDVAARVKALAPLENVVRGVAGSFKSVGDQVKAVNVRVGEFEAATKKAASAAKTLAASQQREIQAAQKFGGAALLGFPSPAAARAVGGGSGFAPTSAAQEQALAKAAQAQARAAQTQARAQVSNARATLQSLGGSGGGGGGGLVDGILKAADIFDVSRDRIRRAIFDIRIALVTLGGAALARSIVNTASDFQDALGQIEITANDTGKPIKFFKDQLLELSKTSPTGLLDLSRGLATAIGTLPKGGDQAREAIEILKAADQAARASGSTVQDTIGGITAVLNTYRKTGITATEVTDKLVQTFDQGGATVPQLAASIGQVTGIASTFGIKIDELFGSISVLTRSGFSASEAITNLRQAFVTLARPPEIVQKRAEALGISLGDAALRSKGLVGVLREIEKVGGRPLLAELMTDIQGFNAASTLMSVGLEVVDKDINQMSKSAGRAQSAVEILEGNFNTFAGLLRNKIVTLLVAIGEKIFPQLQKSFESLGNFIVANQKEIVDAVSGVFNAFVSFASFLKENASTIITTLGTIFVASKILAVAAALGQYATALTAAFNVMTTVGATAGVGFVAKFVSAFPAIGVGLIKVFTALKVGGVAVAVAALGATLGYLLTGAFFNVFDAFENKVQEGLQRVAENAARQTQATLDASVKRHGATSLSEVDEKQAARRRGELVDTVGSGLVKDFKPIGDVNASDPALAQESVERRLAELARIQDEELARAKAASIDIAQGLELARQFGTTMTKEQVGLISASGRSAKDTILNARNIFEAAAREMADLRRSFADVLSGVPGEKIESEDQDARDANIIAAREDAARKKLAGQKEGVDKAKAAAEAERTAALNTLKTLSQISIDLAEQRIADERRATDVAVEEAERKTVGLLNLEFEVANARSKGFADVQDDLDTYVFALEQASAEEQERIKDDARVRAESFKGFRKTQDAIIREADAKVFAAQVELNEKLSKIQRDRIEEGKNLGLGAVAAIAALADRVISETGIKVAGALAHLTDVKNRPNSFEGSDVSPSTALQLLGDPKKFFGDALLETFGTGGVAGGAAGALGVGSAAPMAAAIIALPDILNAAADFLNTGISDWAENAGAAFANYLDALINGLPGQLDKLFGETIPRLIEELVGALPEIIGGLIILIPRIIIAFVKAIPEMVAAFGRGLVGAGKDFAEVFASEAARSFGRVLAQIFERLFGNIIAQFEVFFGGLFGGLKTLFVDMFIALGEAFADLGRDIKSGGKDLALSPFRGLEGAGKGIVNSAANAFGFDDVFHEGGMVRGSGSSARAALGLAMSGAPAFAFGGLVGAPGAATRAALGRVLGGDDVPMIGQAGEGVINRRGMADIGEDGLARINRGQGAGGPAQVSVNLGGRRDVKALMSLILGEVSVDIASPSGQVRRAVTKTQRAPIMTTFVRRT